MKNKISLRAGAILLLALLAFGSCAKHTTSKKVNKKLTEGTWKISQATVSGNNITSTYNGMKFTFSGSGVISVSGTENTSGSWLLGDEENPVLMVLSFPQTATTLYQFSDDWLVMEMSKNDCSLKRNDSATQDDKLVFRRID